MAFHQVQGITMFLSGSGITESQTTIGVTACTYPSPDTNPPLITMADFGDIGYGTLEPETAFEENFSFTGITQNADGSAEFTGVVRGLQFKTPYTADLNLRQPHAGGVAVRFTNSAPFYFEFPVKQNDETWTGKGTLPAANIWEYDVHPAFSTDTQIIDKKYADDLVIAGAPDANTTTKGIVQIATQTDVDAKTAIGSTGASLVAPPNLFRATKYIDFLSSTTGTDAYAITPDPAVTTLVDGRVFIVEVDVANTGAATLAVGITAAKPIVKYGGAALVTGDIAAGSAIILVYDADSDSYMLQTAIAKQQITQDFREVFGGTSGAGTDAYIGIITPAPAAYVTGAKFTGKADVANTGAATYQVNALAAIAIKKNGGTDDLETGDIKAGQMLDLIFDGTFFQLNTPTALPASRPFKAFGLQTLGDTVETTVATYTIPAGRLGLKSGMRIDFRGSYGGNNDTKTIRVKLGGSTVITETIAASTVTFETIGEYYFFNDGAANTQQWIESRTDLEDASGTNVRSVYSQSVTSAINTAVAQVLEITIQMANASDAFQASANFELMDRE